MSTFALEQIDTQFPDALLERRADRSGVEWGLLRHNRIAEVLSLVKEQLGFRLFLTIEGLDRLQLTPDEQNPRFEIAYAVRNVERNELLLLKVRVNEGEDVPSVTKVFQGAAWAERTVFDFYGVRFTGHPDLKRLYMYETFQGHPLRKDYPLRGRQPLIPERPIRDLFRGPGTNNPAD